MTSQGIPSTREEKGAVTGKRESIGLARSLERWLLSSSSGSREPGLRPTEELESRRNLEPQGKEGDRDTDYYRHRQGSLVSSLEIVLELASGEGN